jgi:transposase InsO family protein
VCSSDLFRDRCIPDIGRDWSLVPAMGLWVGDHRQFDAFVPCPVERFDRKLGRTVTEWAWRRPWITAYIDALTWKCVARRIRFEDPDDNQVMITFVAGVSEHGKPSHLYLDNGKDFRARRFAGGRAESRRKLFDEAAVQPMLELLGIPVTWATPYNARAKIIEPWFRLVSERFDRVFDTYAGNRQDRKPERLKALRHKAGEYAANGFTLASFTQVFDRWMTEDYELRECPVAASKPLTVAEAFVRLRDPAFLAARPTDQDLALLLLPSQAVVVGKQGIYVPAFGRHYWSDELEGRR